MRIPPISAGFCANDALIPGPYRRARSAWMLARKSSGNWRGALDFGGVPGTVEFHQIQEVVQECPAAAPVASNNCLRHLPDTGLIQQSVYEAQAEQPLGFTLCLLDSFHAVLLSHCHCTVSCLAVSSARRFWSSGVRILPVTLAVVCTTNRPTSRFRSASMRRIILRRCLARFARICSAAAMAFWASCSCRRPAAAASFFDQLGCLDIGLHHNFPALDFGLCQLGFYLFCIGNALSDLLTPHFQHFEHGLIGVPVQDKANNAEADDLRDQMSPVHAKGSGDLFDRPPTAVYC